jgi:hypothetical protein
MWHQYITLYLKKRKTDDRVWQKDSGLNEHWIGQAIAGLELKLAYVIHVQELETKHSGDNNISSSKAIVRSSGRECHVFALLILFRLFHGKFTTRDALTAWIVHFCQVQQYPGSVSIVQMILIATEREDHCQLAAVQGFGPFVG